MRGRLDWNTQVSAEKVLDILHCAIRSTTGDETLKFHNLRHSFATWTLLRLILSDQGVSTFRFFKHLPLTWELLNNSKQFLSDLMMTEGPTRKYLYAVASLLGHAGPEMSLEHYVHCCDILLKTMLDRNGLNPKWACLIAASKIKYKTAQRYHYTGYIPKLLIKVREYVPSRIIEQSEIDSPASMKNVSPQQQESISIIEESVRPLWICLYHICAQRLDNDKIVRQYGCTLEQIKLIKRMLLSFVKKRRYPFGFPRKFPADKETSAIIYPPSWPLRLSNKDFLKTLASQLWALFAKDHDLAVFGVNYFIATAWKDKKIVFFKTHEDNEHVAKAIRYLQFLDKIGITDDIKCFVRIRTNRSENHEKAWRRALKLKSNSKIEHMNFKSLEDSEAAKRWLGVKLMFSSDKGEGKRSAQGIKAFSFMMIMASIDFAIHEAKHEENSIMIPLMTVTP